MYLKEVLTTVRCVCYGYKWWFKVH